MITVLKRKYFSDEGDVARTLAGVGVGAGIGYGGTKYIANDVLDALSKRRKAKELAKVNNLSEKEMRALKTEARKVKNSGFWGRLFGGKKLKNVKENMEGVRASRNAKVAKLEKLLEKELAKNKSKTGKAAKYVGIGGAGLGLVAGLASRRGED